MSGKSLSEIVQKMRDKAKLDQLARKKKLKKGLDKKLSFKSLLKTPELRTLVSISKKEIKKSKSEPNFYQKLILDTKPTNEQKDTHVEADTEFYTTPQLSTILNTPDFPQESMNHIGETLLAFKQTLMDVPPGEIRGVCLHTTLDDVMDAEDKKAQELGEDMKLTCKKGCAHCCHKLVYVTPDEGVLLARNLMALEGGQISDHTMKMLQFQASYEPHQQLDYWLLDEKQSKCVFLGPDKSCTVYSNRPVNCRLMRVKSPAYNCSKVATMRGQNEIEQNLSLMGEMLVSAAYDVAQTEQRPILTIPQAILNSIKDVQEDSTRKLMEDLNKGYSLETGENQKMDE